MLVIGEKINATRKSVGEAIKKRDEDFIRNLALSQANAGADFIDVNAGESATAVGGSAMEWLVELLQDVTEKPLAIDSDSPEVIAAALRCYRGEDVMINSVTAEPERLHTVGPLAAGKKARLVALAMGSEGIPPTVEKRLEACEAIMDYLAGLGMSAEQVYFDPLVLPVSVDTSQGMVTLQTIAGIKKRIPQAKTVMGLSNVSYGLPGRSLLNRSFLAMAAYAGLDAVIMDPLDSEMMGAVRAADLLTGADMRCRRYIRLFRQAEGTR